MHTLARPKDFCNQARGGGWGDGAGAPDGDAVAPPELPRDAPVTDAAQPHVVHLLKPLWDNADVAVRHDLPTATHCISMTQSHPVSMQS